MRHGLILFFNHFDFCYVFLVFHNPFPSHHFIYFSFRIFLNLSISFFTFVFLFTSYI